MREGLASKKSENSDLESHFGSTIDVCGNAEVHCMNAGFTFSIPNSRSITEWHIYEYRCRMSGTEIDGNVSCFSSETKKQFQYWIVDGYISEFRLKVEGYPNDAFFYRSRKSGLSIKVLKNF